MTTDNAQDRGDDIYAAKLLFQFRVASRRGPNKRRLSEERIIQLTARSPKQALTFAERKGRAAQHHYRNAEKDVVHFEFIGVMDLLHLGPECEEGEVWYELTRRLNPMERKEKLIPPDSKLLSRLSNTQGESRG